MPNLPKNDVPSGSDIFSRVLSPFKNKILLVGVVFLVVLFVLVWLLSSYVYYQDGQLTFGHVVARVNGRVLTDADYNQHKAVYIGQKQCNSSSKVTASYQEVVSYLVKVTKEKDEATSKGLIPTKMEIQEEMESEALAMHGAANLLSKCGWTADDFSRSIEIRIIEKKLGVG